MSSSFNNLRIRESLSRRVQRVKEVQVLPRSGLQNRAWFRIWSSCAPKCCKFDLVVLSAPLHFRRHAKSWTTFLVSYRLSSQSAIAVATGALFLNSAHEGPHIFVDKWRFVIGQPGNVHFKTNLKITKTYALEFGVRGAPRSRGLWPTSNKLSRIWWQGVFPLSIG